MTGKSFDEVSKAGKLSRSAAIAFPVSRVVVSEWTTGLILLIDFTFLVII